MTPCPLHPEAHSPGVTADGVHVFRCTRCARVEYWPADVLTKADAWFLLWAYEFWQEVFREECEQTELLCPACRQAEGLWLEVKPVSRRKGKGLILRDTKPPKLF